MMIGYILHMTTKATESEVNQNLAVYDPTIPAISFSKNSLPAELRAKDL